MKWVRDAGGWEGGGGGGGGGEGVEEHHQDGSLLGGCWTTTARQQGNGLIREASLSKQGCWQRILGLRRLWGLPMSWRSARASGWEPCEQGVPVWEGGGALPEPLLPPHSHSASDHADNDRQQAKERGKETEAELNLFAGPCSHQLLKPPNQESLGRSEALSWWQSEHTDTWRRRVCVDRWSVARVSQGHWLPPTSPLFACSLHVRLHFLSEFSLCRIYLLLRLTLDNVGIFRDFVPLRIPPVPFLRAPSAAKVTLEAKSWRWWLWRCEDERSLSEEMGETCE